MLSGLGNEPRESGQHSVECLDALFGVGCWKLSKCAAFVWICFNSSFCKIETEEFTRLDSEGAFFWIESHVIFPSLLEHSSEMSGMIRCVEAKNKQTIRDKMTAIAESTAAGFGGSAEVEFIQGFPAVNNDARLTVNVMDAAEKSLEHKDDIVVIQRPHLGSEDFAYYQEELPGVIFMLGCRQEDVETGSLHSAILNIDEGSFRYGMRIFANIALDVCGK